jgi:hypothetical protein
VKAERLLFVRNHLRFMDDEAGNGVGLVIRQLPVRRSVQVADRHRPFDKVNANGPLNCPVPMIVR